jgi:hypothetical protein
VIASILSTILAMVIGFQWLLVLSLAVYAAGVLAVSGIHPAASAGGQDAR